MSLKKEVAKITEELVEHLETVDQVYKDSPKIKKEMSEHFIGSCLRSIYFRGQIDLYAKLNKK